MVVVSLLGTAAALWGATKVSWGSDHQLGSSFDAVALLALASVAGVFAVNGWVRRCLGAVIAVAGGFVCWQAIAAPGGENLLSGRGLALLGGVLFLAAGVLVVRYATTLPAMGARYQLVDAERRSGDPDKDMWDDLSHGEDPTRNERGT
ncbi:tryptophan-associated transmembrane protein [Actinophytocola oryzae]|uniref:Tryptophan-associated transmembrane protein n=2 Tax=Actinophytocola oryzae TaxID=502181 RepID=A0A4R7VB77_9PSEU|nr:tryptophan-associated transmembrane protein [Actinophytocola oryzae]